MNAHATEMLQRVHLAVTVDRLFQEKVQVPGLLVTGENAYGLFLNYRQTVAVTNQVHHSAEQGKASVRQGQGKVAPGVLDPDAPATTSEFESYRVEFGVFRRVVGVSD